jgi:hypothetical protein
MVRVQERRRHARCALAFPAVVRDKSGRVLLRGRTADIAPGGIRVIGKGGAALRDAQRVWVEMSVPQVKANGPRRRAVKLNGEVRRITIMGDWRSAVVVVFDSNFSKRLLDPAL